VRSFRVIFLAIALLILGALPAAAAGAAPRLTVTVAGQMGAALAGARVELINPGTGTVAVAVTDAAGMAALAPVRTGVLFWVRVWGNGHRTATRPWVPAVDGGRLTISLEPLAGQVSGVVTDNLGLPVAGARVTAWGNDQAQAAQAVTGAGGEYQLTGLTSPGPYVIRATRTGYRPALSPSLPTARGRESRLDMTLLPLTGRISGDVVEEIDGNPVSGGRVELLRKGWGIVAASATDAMGHFALTAPAADSADYTLRVWADNGWATSPAPFALPPGSVKDFTGADRLVATVQGSVDRLVDIVGTVEDDQNSPVGGASVSLYRTGETGPVATVQAGKDGTFRMKDISLPEKGAYALETVRTGYVTSSDTAPVTGIFYDAVLPVTLRLHPATAILHGRVADPDGAATAGAVVTVTNAADGKAWTAPADADGWYSLSGLPAGPGDLLVLTAASPGARTVTPGEGPVTLAGLRSRSVYLQAAPPVEVAGTVTGQAGAGLAGVTVELWHEGEVRAIASAMTDDAGHYQFAGLIPGERYAVAAVINGTSFSLEPGEPTITPLLRAEAGVRHIREIEAGN
jgi:large repetitive protein